jgi:hypothetical protein
MPGAPAAHLPAALMRLITRALILTALLAAILGLIVAQPAENPARAFFAAQGCPMPCWQGLRPGVTPRAVAESALAAHPWIDLSGDIDVPGVAYSRTYDLWRWTDAFPFPIQIERPDIAFTDGVIGYIDRRSAAETPVVGGIQMTTGLRLGDIWRLLGTPNALISEGYVGAQGERLHEIGLYNLGGSAVDATAYQACPITFRTLLESPVIIRLSPSAQIVPRAAVLTTLYRLLRLRQISVCG